MLVKEQMRIISLTNIKGGVTKTTSTVNLGFALAHLGYKVLIVDTDPQCNSTYTLIGNIYEETVGTLYESLKSETPIQEIVTPTSNKNLFLAPASMWLCAMDIELVNRQGREWVLKRALKGLVGFDFVLIDTMPS